MTGRQWIWVCLAFVVGMTPSWGADRLIVSNYPELIASPGRVFDEALEGPTRVIVYHKSGASMPLNIVLQLFNPTDDPITAQLSSGLGGPNPDGIYAGHIAAKQYFESVLQDGQTVEVQSKQRLNIGKMTVEYDQVMSMIADITGPGLRVGLQVIDPEYPSLSGFKTQFGDLIYSPASFSEISRKVAVTVGAEPGLQEVGIGDVPFLSDTKSGTLLKGNYGLIYEVSAALVNPTAYYKSVDLLLSPTGGVGRAVALIDGELVESGFLRPHQTHQPEKLGSYMLPPRAERHISIMIMPQPGSFYPVHMVFKTGIPEGRPKEIANRPL